MIYETNKVRLHGLVRNKERTEQGLNKVRLSIGKGLKNIITCYTRDDIYLSMKISETYEIEGYLVPLDSFNNNLAINITKCSLTDAFNSDQFVEVMFKIVDVSNIFKNQSGSKDYSVRDLSVEFKNKNLKNLDLDISLWGKLSELEGLKKGRDAYARCFISSNSENRYLRLVPYAVVLL